jgi:hypothetical protein
MPRKRLTQQDAQASALDRRFKSLRAVRGTSWFRRLTVSRRRTLQLGQYAFGWLLDES